MCPPFSYGFGRQKSKMVQQDCFYFLVYKGEHIPLSFLASRAFLLSLICGPSAIFKSTTITSSSLSLALSLFLSLCFCSHVNFSLILTLLSPLIMILVIRPIPIILDNFLISISLIKSHKSAKFFCHVKVKYSEHLFG